MGNSWGSGRDCVSAVLGFFGNFWSVALGIEEEEEEEGESRASRLDIGVLSDSCRATYQTIKLYRNSTNPYLLLSRCTRPRRQRPKSRQLLLRCRP